MSRVGMTKAPCHGCGQVQPHGRPKEGLCRECRKRLDATAHLEERLAALRAELGSTVRARVPGYMSYGEGNLFHGRIRGRDWSEELGKAVRAVVLATTRERLPDESQWSSSGTDEWIGPYRDGGQADVRYATAEVVAALQHLDTTIRASLDVAYVFGRNNGKNILQRLASGDIAVPEFEKPAFEEKRLEKLEDTDDE